MRILITGGAGFIGSHLVDMYVSRGHDVTVIDNLSYASNFANIKSHVDKKDVRFILGDIRNYALYCDILADIELVIHTAAESHVDNSFFDPNRFVLSNVEGTQVLLEACRRQEVDHIIHFSTDEIYGDVHEHGFGQFIEEDRFNPTNPYSASKAAAEMIVNAYVKSFGMNITTVRPNNVYGIRQHWEKLIPTCITHLKDGKKIPIHGDGEQVRNYLSVHDLCYAIYLLDAPGLVSQTYNIGTESCFTVNKTASLICKTMGKRPSNSIEYIDDRPYNDLNYHTNFSKLTKATGWRPGSRLNEDISEIVDWYMQREAPFTHGWFKND